MEEKFLFTEFQATEDVSELQSCFCVGQLPVTVESCSSPWLVLLLWAGCKAPKYSEDEETKQPAHLMVSGKLQRDRECFFKGISASE